MEHSIELQRQNVTLAEFLAYVKKQCQAKGIPCDIERDEFENPSHESHMSYVVVNGVKKCSFEEYRTHTNLRRKHASYTTPEGYTRYYYTNELEEYSETKLHHWNTEESAEDAACQAETVRQFSCDTQTYIRNFDGTFYNEICEFTFDTEKRGHGYYYQANKS